MEVQVAIKSGSRASRRATPPRHIHVGDTTTKAVPNYLKPSTGSCHHACKYGGTHTFEDAHHQPNSNKTTTTTTTTRKLQKKRTTPPPLVRARLVPPKLFSRGDHRKVEDDVLVAGAAVNQKKPKTKKKAGDDDASAVSLLRDLEEKMMVQEAATDRGNESYCSLDQEECAAAAEASRPIPAHRRVKSMSISSRSVRFPFKLRSKSSRAGPAILPSEKEEKIKPPRIRSRRGSMGGGGDDVGSTGTGTGIQLRIRSLRRRGVGGGSSGGATTTGFVVPAVSLRHQKTLEKKRSQRLYNNVIEETASKLVKTRKSRVKALVGAFESVISRIAK